MLSPIEHSLTFGIIYPEQRKLLTLDLCRTYLAEPHDSTHKSGYCRSINQ